MGYITVGDFKTYHGGISGTSEDALIQSLIDETEKTVDMYTGTTFEATDTTRYFDAVTDRDGYVLYLGYDNLLASITTITNGDSVVVSASEYVTEPRNAAPYYAIRLLSSSGKSWTYGNDPENAITIVGSFGWSTTPPADIVLATKIIVNQNYSGRNPANQLDRPVVVGGGVVLAPVAIPAMAKQILDRYRVI